MKKFNVEPTPLSGLCVVERLPAGDDRGFFERLYCNEMLESLFGQKQLVQINHSMNASRGTIRGMHFQRPPHSEIKMVSCFRGSVFDVAVDIRKDSPTYLKWFGTVLSKENHKSLFIPEGFAHGFQTLEEDSELLYFHTSAYEPLAEGGIRFDDPAVGIEWPLPVSNQSERDKQLPTRAEGFEGI